MKYLSDTIKPLKNIKAEKLTSTHLDLEQKTQSYQKILTLDNGTEIYSTISSSNDGTLYDLQINPGKGRIENEPLLRYKTVMVQIVTRGEDITSISLKPKFKPNFKDDGNLGWRDISKEYRGRDDFAYGFSISCNESGNFQGTMKTLGFPIDNTNPLNLTQETHNTSLTNTDAIVRYTKELLKSLK